jgi:hypothetical protein
MDDAQRPADPSELRAAPRTRALRQTFIRVCRAGGGVARPMPAHVRDLSCRGIGFVYCEKLEPGSQFAIELTRGSQVVRRLLYVVVRCQPWDHRSFHIGARFVCLARNNTGAAADPAAVRALKRAILA